MNYATFWQRFGAMWIDFFVLVPLLFVAIWTQSISREVALILLVPMMAAFSAYTIYCHGRYGQTLGKMAVGIRVVRTTGEPIGWDEAWMRSSIDVMFATLGVVSSAIALIAIPDAQYHGIDWIERSQRLQALEPAWLAWTPLATQIWVWSEVVVMLFNKERRALHDFIAGTVVTSDRRDSHVRP